MKTVKFHIDDWDDRSALVSILANNGYWCKVIKKKESFDEKFYVVVKLKNVAKKGKGKK